MSTVLLKYVWRICNVYGHLGVSATYMDILAYLQRIWTSWSNVFNGSHTQSTLFIRRYTLTFVDIPGPKCYSYAIHRFTTVSICIYMPSYVFARAFCAYEKYFMNFHTQQYDRVIMLAIICILL